MPELSFFTQQLLSWWATYKRTLPWKATNNPYLIWLSEIILQQTRVEQGRPYFEKFAKTYPTVKHLADASQDEVMWMWEGLGYYSRARNLHTTAKYIAYDLGGKFPDTYEDIKKLKGVGNYTAAAIASFAYDLPYAVLDGNVFRILARYFNKDTPIDSTKGKKEFAILAQNLLATKKPADFNQAIMDFGSLQCKPKNPNCMVCPLQTKCQAFTAKTVAQLPVKSKKIKRKERCFNYLVLHQEDIFWLEKRQKNDIWRNLYQFPLLEEPHLLNLEQLQTHPNWIALQEVFGKENISCQQLSKPYKQLLTHQQINARFFDIVIKKEATATIDKLIQVKQEDVPNYAFPKVINQYWENTWLGDNQQLILKL